MMPYWNETMDMFMFLYNNYLKIKGFTTWLVIGFQNCIKHLQLQVFKQCECYQTSCTSWIKCNASYYMEVCIYEKHVQLYAIQCDYIATKVSM
jgi:hypothetical protein